MATSPLYPGYKPKKPGEEPISNPAYPGYYTGQALPKKPQSKDFVKPIEYNFDVFMEKVDEVGEEISNLPLAVPKWVKDRIVDDWKQQLKVSASPKVNLDPTDLDDYATDDLVGATTKLSLNPKDWGIGHKDGIKQTGRQLFNTLKDWSKETTGVDYSNLLKSDFSDIENKARERLWINALGYGDSTYNELEKLGGRAIADRTTAFFKDQRGNRKPLNLKGVSIADENGVVERDVYRSVATAAAEFERSMDSPRDRDTKYTSFVSKGLNTANKEIMYHYLRGNDDVKSAIGKHAGAVEFFDIKAQTLETIEKLQEKTNATAKTLRKVGLGKSNTTALDALQELRNKHIEETVQQLANLSSKAQALSGKGIPQKEINKFIRETTKYSTRVASIQSVVEDSISRAQRGGLNILGLGEAAKKIEGRTPGKNFNSRTTFKGDLGDSLRKDMERSMMSNNSHDIGSLLNNKAVESELASHGIEIKAKKLTPIMHRLRQDRIRFATKEVLDAYDKGGAAQVIENYAWKKIKDIAPRWIERAISGEIVGESLKKTNYFGLKVDEDYGVPEEGSLRMKRFDRKFGNTTKVKLDPGLRFSGLGRTIKVSGKEIEEGGFKGLYNHEVGGVKTLKILDFNVKDEKVFEENRILLSKLLNNDRSEITLDQLSQTLFGMDYNLAIRTKGNKDILDNLIGTQKSGQPMPADKREVLSKILSNDRSDTTLNQISQTLFGVDHNVAMGSKSSKSTLIKLLGYEKSGQVLAEENRILFSKLLNNDRSEATLNQLSQKLFGVNYNVAMRSESSRGTLNKLVGYEKDGKWEKGHFDKVGDWIDKKTGGKVKVLPKREEKYIKLNKKIYGIDRLTIFPGKHTDFLKNDLSYKLMKNAKNKKETYKHFKDLFQLDSELKGKTREDILKKMYLAATGNVFDPLSAEGKKYIEFSEQIRLFSEWVKNQKGTLGDKSDSAFHRLQIFLTLRKEGLKEFEVDVDDKNAAFLFFTSVLKQNESMSYGYKLTDKKYVGRLEKINRRMQALKKRWEKTLLAKIIRIVTSWKDIIAEKASALIAKLVSRLVGVTVASTGLFATLMPVAQAFVEKTIKKAFDYVTSTLKGILTLNFSDLDKLLEKDLKHLLVPCTCVLAGCAPVAMGVSIVIFTILGVIPKQDASQHKTSSHRLVASNNASRMYASLDTNILPATTSDDEDEEEDFITGEVLLQCANAFGESKCTGKWDNVRDFGPGLGGFYYNQWDPQWKDVEIDNSGEYIGPVGCYVTSVAMVSTYFGDKKIPSVIAGENRFGCGCAACMCDPSVSGSPHTSPTLDKNELKQWFSDNPNGIAILKLMTNSDPKNPTQHFVVITGYQEDMNDFILYDPDRAPELCLEIEYPGVPWGYVNLYPGK